MRAALMDMMMIDDWFYFFCALLSLGCLLPTIGCVLTEREQAERESQKREYVEGGEKMSAKLKVRLQLGACRSSVKQSF
jgi:hypothetical protein